MVQQVYCWLVKLWEVSVGLTSKLSKFLEKPSDISDCAFTGEAFRKEFGVQESSKRTTRST